MSLPLKKKIRPGKIELDPDEPTIIVHMNTVTVDPNIPGKLIELF